MAQELKDVVERAKSLQAALADLPVVSSRWREAIRNLLTRPAPMQLPAHRRADDPVFTEQQVEMVCHLVAHWAEAAARAYGERLAFENPQCGLGSAKEFALRSTQRKLNYWDFSVRTVLRDALRDSGLHWDDRFAVDSIMQAVHYWIDWRVRASQPHIYGDVSSVVQRAAWALREQLLTMERQSSSSTTAYVMQ